MRIVREIPHNRFKITVFSWNGKYLVKIEAGMYEQVYKISEMDLTGEEDLDRIIDEAFLERVTGIFKEMYSNLSARLPD
jgi:hypothetical protein